MVMFDLTQGYHHVLMDPEVSCLLSFQVGLCWYNYLVLLFSLKCTLWVFMKIVWLMVVFWRQHGVIVMSYIDDFMVLGWSKECAVAAGSTHCTAAPVAWLGSQADQGSLGANSGH
jgi:hypothetical protein